MVALVQRSAPTFKAEAVADGLFVDVDLEKYRGQWYAFSVGMKNGDVSLETRL